MSKHQRRLQLLKAKLGNEKHPYFLYTLENLMSVAEFKMMTSEEMIIHLRRNSRQHDVQTGLGDPSRIKTIINQIKNKSNGN